MNYDNEDAIAYGYMMIMLYFGVGALLWLSWSWIFNQLLTVAINPDIEAGRLSVQTVNAINWPVNVLRYAPPVILLFGFIYAVNRAIFKRSTG